MNALSKQLTSASNSVENLGKRTRAMSRKLKDVELFSDQGEAEKLLGLSAGEIVDGEAEEGGSLVEKTAPEIIVHTSRSAPVNH